MTQIERLIAENAKLRKALAKIAERADDNLPMYTPGAMVHIAEEALTAAQVLGEPDGWEPISTAPKDWSDVLLFDPDYGSDLRNVFEGYYSCEDGGRGCWVDAGNESVNPTHWRPLPLPPALQEPRQ